MQYGQIVFLLFTTLVLYYAARTVVTHLIDYGTTRFEMGYASAIATILFAVMLLLNKAIQSLLSKVGT